MNCALAMENDGVPVITIDGPVGSGKGTVASRLAARLGWHLLDSGHLYRLVALRALHADAEARDHLAAVCLIGGVLGGWPDRDGPFGHTVVQDWVALRALREGLTSEQEKALESVAERLDSEFRFEDGVTRIFLDGKEVTRDLRVEAVSAMASRVAAVPAVRAALAQRQRDFRRPPGLVADGRDMGTVIFPEAPLKIYLTASVQARAERRYKQLKEKGESVNLSRLFRDIEKRDERDSSRAVSPLRPAHDAHVIDSTDMSIDEVLKIIHSL